jgi:hypothetical protein
MQVELAFTSGDDARFGFDSSPSFMISLQVTKKKGCCPLYWIAVYRNIKK